ncbi:SURF1 family protein [Variovorax sp.]|uniref:SURF1 family protein n=1 Tax=Variovorax sp. TaxID=1871043 RepID=UPI002D61B781|nr:SURF1 family protein [Variovorax sp.]HYP83432.1 SURF1 family protein [Variovorax sp.]
MSPGHSTRTHAALSPASSSAPRRALRWLIALVALALIATGIALGRWQLSRASQKEAMQAQIEAQGKLPPLSQEEFLAMDKPLASEHRRVHLRGLWLGAQTVYLDNRQMHGVPGFYVLTPFALEGTEQTLMIQRGWIQRNFEDRAKLQPVQTPPGIVEIDAVIAAPPAHLLDLGEPAASAPAATTAPPADGAPPPQASTTTTTVTTDPESQRTLSDTPVAPRLHSLPVQPQAASEAPATSEATTQVPSPALQQKAAQDKATPAQPLAPEARAAAPGRTAIRQNLDLAAFRGETGLPLRTELSLQQVGAASEGLQRDWPAPALGVERHYGYAFQWFSLSAVVAILYVWFQIIVPFRRRRRASRFHD